MATLLLFSPFVVITSLVKAQSPKWIYVSDLTKNWFDAEAYCAATYGTHLASWSTVEEALELQNLVGDLYVWVGLNDLGTNQFWEFSDGSVDCGAINPVNGCANSTNFPFWAANEPSDDSGTNNDCAHTHGLSDIADWLNDRLCENNLVVNVPGIAFVCNAPFTIVKQGTLVGDADQACLDTYGTHLASIENRADQTYAQSLCDSESGGTLCWLGASHTGTGSACEYSYADGSTWTHSYATFDDVLQFYSASEFCSANLFMCIVAAPHSNTGLHECIGGVELFFPLCNGRGDTAPPTSAPTSSTAAPTPLPTSSPSYVPTSSTAAPSATPLDTTIDTTIDNPASPVPSNPASTISVMTTTAALFGVNISITVHNTVPLPAVTQLTAVLERTALDMTVLTSDCNESVNTASVIEDDRTVIYVVIASCSEESEQLLIAHYDPVRLERDVIGIGLNEAEVEVHVEAIGAADERPAEAAEDQDDAVWGWWPFAWISPWIGVAVVTAAVVAVSVTICSCVWCGRRSKRRRKSASAADESNDACGGIGAMSDGPERANTAMASSTVTPRPPPRAPPVPPPALQMATTSPGDSGPYGVDVPSIMANAHYQQQSIQACGGDESDSEELYQLSEHEPGQTPQQLGGQTQGAGDADEIQTQGNVLSDVLCADCGAVRAGRVDDIDGRFYCRECWADYNDRGTGGRTKQ